MKLASLLAGASMLCLAAAAASADDLAFLKNVDHGDGPFKIGFSNGFIGNAWRAQHVEGVEKAAAELKEAGLVSDVIVVNSTSGASGQIAQINSLLAQGIDALVINPVSAEPLMPIVQRAVDSGVLVVVADNPLPMDNVLNVSLDHTQYWGISTEWLIDAIGGKGNIVAIEGLAGNTANDWRVRARDAVLAEHPDVTLLSSVIGGWDQAQAREAMAGLLTAYGDQINGVLIQEVMNEGAIRAYKAAGVAVPPLTGDYVLSYLKLWKADPELQSVAVANPPGVGSDALRITVELLSGGTLDTEKLVANPLNADFSNTILIPEPYVVEREANTTRPWCSEQVKCISLDEAIALLDGQSDAASLDSTLTQDEVRALYFK
ncbi:MAG: substrate-binding domain-containing protein [Rhodobacteraceae bacterium]|jgi:ribose transport system substrate-binding protein|nr:substrate-binding domain-containing protein [Paracoccaceae bacterium]